jgi:putative spermidine/putrescine transport system permease protein
MTGAAAEAPPVGIASRFARGSHSTRLVWVYLLLPGLFALSVAFLLPIANLGLQSLHLFTGPGQQAPGLTLANYVEFVSDPFYWELLGWTSALGALVVALSLTMALPVGYVLARSRSRWRGPLLLAVIAPMLVSVVIRNLGWLPILGESGVINTALLALGVVDAPLKLSNNFTGVVIGLVHALLPFMILTLATVIQRIDPAIEEASVSLGANPIETFLRVVVPIARPGIIAGSLVTFTLAISAYTTPAIMGGGRVLVMSTYVQQQIGTLLDYPTGATVSIVLLLWGAALSVLALRVGKAEV